MFNHRLKTAEEDSTWSGKPIRHYGTPFVLMMGFGSIILIGALLLMLPISLQDGNTLSFIDALFTSTSAVCVTGLTVINVGVTLSIFGQAVLAVLIQVGGLGFMSVTIAMFILLGKRIGLRERIVLRDSLGQQSISGVIRLVKSVAVMTITIESVGALLSFIALVKYFPVPTALRYAVFNSISAFNNAGFDLFGTNDSLMRFAEDPLLICTTAGLIIFGGIGFIVLHDIWRNRNFRHLTMHSKIVLFTTLLLLVGGTLLFKLTDGWDFLTCFFQSVTARTAGFNSTDMAKMSSAGELVMMFLMFVGASPGSTGGGIKTTTLFTMVLAALSLSRGTERTAFKRKIPAESVIKAFIVTLTSAAIVMGCVFLVSIGNPEMGFSDILFETISAVGTVGLSMGITPSLAVTSKIFVALAMFFGRVGPFTVACAWTIRKSSSLSYIEENITVG